MNNKKIPCGQKTEVYSRVVGYYRPVQNWNKGKKEEFGLRKTFHVAVSATTEASTIVPLVRPGESREERVAASA